MLLIKPLSWLGDSLDQVRAFAPEARARIGFELWEVQQGNAPADWKPVTTVGPGVSEIRVHVKGEYRVLYIAKFADAVHVLHAFGNKTRKTPKRDIDLATMRLSRTGPGDQESTLMKARAKTQRGSGNVFRDLGFPQPEAENLLLRAQLMSEIREAARGMTQSEAAKQFGVTQPRVNDLLRGKIDKFSLDALVNMLAKAGMRVEMRVKKAA